MTPEERLDLLEAERAILATMYRYGHALDYGDTEQFLDCFTSDGFWEAPQLGHFEGHDRLTHFFAWHTHAPEKYHKHLLIEPRIEVSGDDASVVSYWVRLDTEEAGPYVASFGRYRDRLRRDQDGAWRFSARVIEAESSRPRPGYRGPDG